MWYKAQAKNFICKKHAAMYVMQLNVCIDFQGEGRNLIVVSS